MNCEIDNPTGARVLALRRALHLTQERISACSGLDRITVIAIEKGRNQAGSRAVLRGLASAFRLTLDDMDAYLEGNLSLEHVLERRLPSPTELESAAAA